MCLKSVFTSKRDINTIIWDTEIEKKSDELANESLEKDTQTFHIESEKNTKFTIFPNPNQIVFKPDFQLLYSRTSPIYKS